MFGDNEYFQTDPHWRDLVPFHEYFDGDTGKDWGQPPDRLDGDCRPAAPVPGNLYFRAGHG